VWLVAVCGVFHQLVFFTTFHPMVTFRCINLHS
jgi:hypothetical protein